MNSFLFFYPDTNNNLPQSKHKFAQIKGATVEYIENNGVCTAVRVISSDPSHYLDSEISPGADITRAVNSQIR